MLRSTEAWLPNRWLLLLPVVLWARIGLAACGDAVLDPGEACDDGNLAAGDCCTPACTAEPAGDPCLDDGNPCSLDECDGSGSCVHPTGGSASCDDGDVCTTNDACTDGVCSGTVVPGSCIDAVLCRRARPIDPFGRFTVGVDDGSDLFKGRLRRPRELCLPASTTGGPVLDASVSLVSSRIRVPEGPLNASWHVTDEFGALDVETLGAEHLFLASSTSSVAPPPAPPPAGSANHYSCRRVRLAPGSHAPRGHAVTIDDALGSHTAVLAKPRRLCHPADVDASGTGRAHPRPVLLCYGLLPGHSSNLAPATFATANQLATVGLDALGERELCVPAVAQGPAVPLCATGGDECGLPCCRAFSGQHADCSYNPALVDPRYLGCSGPTILFDRTHANFHQVTPESERSPGRFWGFAKLLVRDGYVVRDSTTPLTTLLPGTSAKILAIANPRALIGDVAIPAPDVTALVSWVEQGGSLLVSIDHNPYDKTEALLGAFGLQQSNRNARRFTFTVANGGLNAGSPIASGISEVTTFLGTAFRISSSPPPQASYDPVLTYPAGSPNNLVGLLQGVAIEFGAGRVYVSSESGGLTAQSSFGMQETPDNEQFVRNIIHWLDD